MKAGKMKEVESPTLAGARTGFFVLNAECGCGSRMALSVDMPLEDALDNGWKMLARHFKKEEASLNQEVLA